MQYPKTTAPWPGRATLAEPEGESYIHWRAAFPDHSPQYLPSPNVDLLHSETNLSDALLLLSLPMGTDAKCEPSWLMRWSMAALLSGRYLGRGWWGQELQRREDLR